MVGLSVTGFGVGCFVGRNVTGFGAGCAVGLSVTGFGVGRFVGSGVAGTANGNLKGATGFFEGVIVGAVVDWKSVLTRCQHSKTSQILLIPGQSLLFDR